MKFGLALLAFIATMTQACGNTHLVTDVQNPKSVKLESGDLVPCNTGTYTVNNTLYAVGCATNPVNLDDEELLADGFAATCLKNATGEIAGMPVGHCYTKNFTCAVYESKK